MEDWKWNHWHHFHACVQSNEWLHQMCSQFIVNCSGLLQEYLPARFFRFHGHAWQCSKRGFWGSKIFVRLPLSLNNLMHFHGIVHELKIKDETALPPPCFHLRVRRHKIHSQQLWCRRPTGIELGLLEALSLSYFVLKLDCRIHHHRLSSIWFPRMLPSCPTSLPPPSFPPSSPSALDRDSY